jgi:patatin-related protein
MREKELRLALVCYGGISLAVYMHGVTKEVWRLARASRAFHDGSAGANRVEAVWVSLLRRIAERQSIKMRILPDIIAGASAGGINGIFLAQALSSGHSLDPLTGLWLDNADVDQLLDPDARPLSAFTKFWAMPIAWWVSGKRGGTVEKTVAVEARGEVRAKLSRLVRARWFAPPFGGEGFTAMLLDAFEAMGREASGPRLLPDGHPLDLFVTVTDFAGYSERLRLNSPAEISETEHRLTISFSDRDGDEEGLGDNAELTFAARATASFPGAFPPFTVAELDRVVATRSGTWANRNAFLARILPGHGENAERAILIDGSVLANAPFAAALGALRDRPSRREVDRRFVYIDPKPGIRAIGKTRKGGTELPGFLATIFGAMSDIPREQPIRDSLEAIEARSARIRRMQRIVEALRPSVETAIDGLFGRTFFLDKPTAARLGAWRGKAQESAARDANFAFAAYGHIKLSGIVEDIAALVQRRHPDLRGPAFEALRQGLWTQVRARGVDQLIEGVRKGASAPAISFFRDHDLGFRIRRLRFVVRTLSGLIDEGRMDSDVAEPVRLALFAMLSKYLEREAARFYVPFDPSNPALLLESVAAQRGLIGLDEASDARLADAFATLPKAERRTVLLAYLGFPYFDISTLPMLQGEGLDEFDPIKIDRISPDDVTTVRKGVTETLKGVQFNSFGAFFSRTYRENDYLWGRLHGADRLFDIVLSSAGLAAAEAASLKRDLLVAILDEEETHLSTVASLFPIIRAEIAAGETGA